MQKTDADTFRITVNDVGDPAHKACFCTGACYNTGRCGFIGPGLVDYDSTLKIPEQLLKEAIEGMPVIDKLREITEGVKRDKEAKARKVASEIFESFKPELFAEAQKGYTSYRISGRDIIERGIVEKEVELMGTNSTVIAEYFQELGFHVEYGIATTSYTLIWR